MTKLEEMIKGFCPNGVEHRKLSEIVKMSRGVRVVRSQLTDDGCYPVFQNSMTPLGYYSEYNCPKDTVFLISAGAAGEIGYSDTPFWAADDCWYFECGKNLIGRFLYYALACKQEYIFSRVRKASVPRLSRNVIDMLQIPLPPLAVQREIVRILDKFTLYSQELAAELAARKKQYEFYRDKLLSFNNLTNGGDNLNNLVRIVELGEIGRVCMCKRILKSQTSSIGDVPFYKIGTFGGEADSYISQQLYEEYRAKYSYPKIGDILISAAGTIGRTVIFDGAPAYFQDSNIVWIDNDEKVALNKYLFYCYQLKPWQVSSGGTISRLYNENISRTEIPVPPLEIQERIVKVLDNFDAICSDLGIGLPAEIEARQRQYEYYRDKLLQF